MLLGAAATAACARATYTQAADQSLAELAAAKGIAYGSMVTWKSWGGDNAISRHDGFEQLVKRECALVVSAMEMFWRFNSETAGSMDFAGADDIVAWSQQNGKKLRGHNLLWYGQTPKWYKGINDRAYGQKAMVEHVTSMCSRFAGKIHSWDVVNETIDIDGAGGLRDSKFVELLGPTFMDDAFHAARAADPKALLVINDYDLEYNTGDQEAKRQALLNVIDGMKQRNVPIDAVGIQSHLSIKDQDSFDQNVFANFLKEVGDRGLQVMLTELDVVDVGAPSDPAQRDAAVAAVYKAYLDAALASPTVKTVATWGLCDHDSWITHYALDQFRRPDGLPPRPLPFDTDLKAKPAYFAIADAFKAAPGR
ncbi:MAG TPA: endo-1,4-beta-xylanase [Candidatus Binatia bacterium]|nr:endo-1,4-beta-xylanase [Candidatus Binatia bacterium]